MSLTSLMTASFARHETFHPRVGWLSKAVQVSTGNPNVFSDEAAPVDLGVGKNMVRAIRYWGVATKVLEERDGSRGGLRPSPLGRFLLSEHGVDPYAEDATTLWLLHWSLLRDPVHAPTWWWVFNEVDLVDFDPAQLVRAETDWILSIGWTKPSVASIERDIDCVLRMYSRRPGQSDPIDSPFAALGLIEPVVGASKRWRFSAGTKETLDPKVVLLASLFHMIEVAPDSQTMSVARLTTARGGPGRAFRLTDSAIASALRAAATELPGIGVTSPAGLAQLAVRGEKATLAADALAACYGRDAGAATRGLASELVDWLIRSKGEAA
jgi:Protein of unknown function (DUF4007)